MKKILSLALAVLMLFSVVSGINLTAFAGDDWETDPIAILQDGWVKKDGVWYYGEKGTAKTGWLKDKGKWYYLSPSEGGAMVENDVRTINGKIYVFNKYGAMLENGWKSLEFKNDDNTTEKVWWYIQSGGAARTGWLLSKGKWYYLNKEYGFMLSNIVYPMADKTGGINDNTDWYAFDKNGAMVTGAWFRFDSGNYSDDIVVGGNSVNWYYANDNGKLAKGWKQVKGKWYYFDRNCAMFSDDWIEGAKSTEDNPVWYYVKPDGAMATGWYKFSEENAWHYFGADGAERYGWQKVNNVWYYLYPKNIGDYDDEDFIGMGTMATGWLELEDGVYYLKSSGAMVTGKQTIDGVNYEFTSAGRLITA